MAVWVASVKSSDLNNCLRDISKYGARCRLNVEKALSNGTRRVAAGARRRAPVDTGKLKKSISSSFKKTTLVGYARAKMPHAHLLEFGVKPSISRPKKARFLKIPTENLRKDFGGAAFIFRKQARIPARRPRPFMMPAFKSEEKNIVDDVKKGLQNA